MSSLRAEAPAGVLAVDKASGWTSHDVVAVVRGIVGVRRVGHGGTLDPLATGILPILVGSATRSVERLHTAPKVYAALVRFGYETTTDDREGAVTREGNVPDVEGTELDRRLDPFRGEILQAPPAYAAVKVGGRRAYQLARAGRPVEPAERPVRVERLAVASWRSPDLRLLVVCGSGTYIRSLARDIGRAVGSAAHLAALRRLAVGALSAEGSVVVDELREGGRDAAIARLRPVDQTVLELDERFRTRAAQTILHGWEVR